MVANAPINHSFTYDPLFCNHFVVYCNVACSSTNNVDCFARKPKSNGSIKKNVFSEI